MSQGEHMVMNGISFYVYNILEIEIDEWESIRCKCKYAL